MATFNEEEEFIFFYWSLHDTLLICNIAFEEYQKDLRRSTPNIVIKVV